MMLGEGIKGEGGSGVKGLSLLHCCSGIAAIHLRGQQKSLSEETKAGGDRKMRLKAEPPRLVKLKAKHPAPSAYVHRSCMSKSTSGLPSSLRDVSDGSHSPKSMETHEQGIWLLQLGGSSAWQGHAPARAASAALLCHLLCAYGHLPLLLPQNLTPTWDQRAPHLQGKDCQTKIE